MWIADYRKKPSEINASWGLFMKKMKHHYGVFLSESFVTRIFRVFKTIQFLKIQAIPSSSASTLY